MHKIYELMDAVINLITKSCQNEVLRLITLPFDSKVGRFCNTKLKIWPELIFFILDLEVELFRRYIKWIGTKRLKSHNISKHNWKIHYLGIFYTDV